MSSRCEKPGRQRRITLLTTLLAVPFVLNTAQATPRSFITGQVRVQPLSASLVRLEVKGPEGFENRQTFHVVNRNWPGTPFSTTTNAGIIEVRTAHYWVHVPANATSLTNVSVTFPSGSELYRYDGQLKNSRWLPSPESKPQAWWFADTPRIVPPPWGLTPPPKPMLNGGWDLSNNAPDVYVFLPQGSYFQLRKDFLKLTGPTEMPPLFMFGAFDSRWYNYSEATALKQIQDYRSRKIPLDVLVVDTGWRAGASTGYHPNTNLFPNLRRFFAEAHARHVKVMFNDHPEPLNTNAPALNEKELNYRFNGLSGILKDGLDVWWYDRNWWVALVTPAPNLRKEVWGMKLYHDTTARVRPGQRPLIMANVDGIDNGIRKRPMDVAAHRYPFQWTGDIGPGWAFLRRAVDNAVYSGVQSLFPYESDDLGGHVANPTTEQYIRWIEYGALSPVYRPHCTFGLKRMPWTFGPEAETVARNFLDMRYRLLPVFYAAAHQNYETGEPVLRRLDLYYPQFAEASRNDEYLLGRNILVAPVLHGSAQVVPGQWLSHSSGQPGLRAEFFTNDHLSSPAKFTWTDKNIDFDWNKTSPAPEIPRTFFSARWHGIIEVPKSVGEVKLATIEDDGVRVWIDGKQVINVWGGHDSTLTQAKGSLTAGVPHRIRIEYQQLNYGAGLKLLWQPAHLPATKRVLWVPPGYWINAWNGQVVAGPVTETNSTLLNQIPLFIKSGCVLPLAPQMQYTGQKPWNPITLDAYPRGGETDSAILYEDDTHSTAYKHGAFRTTHIAVTAGNTGKTVRLDIAGARGSFAGALPRRAWTVRIHPPANWPQNLEPAKVTVNGRTSNLPIQRLQRDPNAMPFGAAAGAPDATVYQIHLPAAPVNKALIVTMTFVPSKQ